MVSATIRVPPHGDHNEDPENSGPATQHSYSTRTRNNSNIRPPVRSRQSPDATALQRKLKIFPTIRAKPGAVPQMHKAFPIFPPPNVMFHPEDANNKVLMSIGRAFLSVDNRAMTIKDLADMCMNFGLMCQSASAAGQAITSFIRSHLQRCDIEQDQPLLLKHVLTGTASDDELISALHSRSGGAHCTLSSTENRLTNFRRGTMIWYLSKAAGAPCPFARAGVRLCDHKDVGDLKPEQHCGQKRKRFLRARSRGRGGSDSEGVNSDTEKRLPKVKLTLRLKPPRMLSINSSTTTTSVSGSSFSNNPPRSPSVIDLSRESDSDSDSMSVDASDDDEQEPTATQAESIFPPYPRQSISIPAYTPSIQDLYPELFISASRPTTTHRSPSVPRSEASPPPDSDDEYISDGVSSHRRHSSARLRSSSKSDIAADFGDVEDEFESGARYESPAPRSPWTPFVEDSVVIKEEPSDVGGILEAWEQIDSITHPKVMDSSSFEAEPKIKSEEYSFWDWNGFDRLGSEVRSSSPDGRPDSIVIKQEDVDNAIILSDNGIMDDDMSMNGPLSAVEPSFLADFTTLRRHSEVVWKDVELLGPDSVHVQEFDDGYCPQPRTSPIRARARTSPSLFASFADSGESAKVAPGDIQLRLERKLNRSESEHDLSSIEPADPTVVHTIRHFTPAVCMVQVDGISIYQLIIDSYPLLRRFDTDFVNLSRIAEYLALSTSSLASVVHATEVVGGCPLLRGKWVPLEIASKFVKEHSSTHPVLDVFLSENLHGQFPSSLQALHRSSQRLRSCNQFGTPFKSTMEDARPPIFVDDIFEANTRWERNSWEDDDHVVSIHPSLAIKSTDISMPPLEEDHSPELALSPIEQEIFQSICGCADWESPPLVTDVVIEAIEKAREEEARILEEQVPCGGRARTLRRSKRVADAIASTRPRTRSSRSKA